MSSVLGYQSLTVSLRPIPDLLELVMAEMKYSCLQSTVFSWPHQRDQIFLKLNRMTYWFARIIHTLPSIKTKKKRKKERKAAERSRARQICAQNGALRQL